jgi:hypothetical protein
MWWTHDMGWGVGIVMWLLAVWVAVLITVWIIFHTFGGPKHHVR